jgi:midasin
MIGPAMQVNTSEAEQQRHRDEEDEIRDVDDQLTNTHLSKDEQLDMLTIADARKKWAEHEARTRTMAIVLSEHLRLILNPTQATKMRGDFRTGKRLNIKKIIPYIASSYKRDKIWMRRAIPSKRSYQIMLAIDDSESMTERESKNLAFDTLALVAKGMSMLEIGEVCVVGFGEEINVTHDFDLPYTSEAGAEILRQFTFTQSKTDVRKLLQESISLFREARMRATGSASDLWQVQLIISDGDCEDHASIRQLVRQAHEERIMVVFIIVDSAARNTTNGTKQSILDLPRAEFVKDANGEAQLKMTKYLDTFPFQYYLIVRDVLELPGVLAGALRQWFAEVVEAGG